MVFRPSLWPNTWLSHGLSMWFLGSEILESWVSGLGFLCIMCHLTYKLRSYASYDMMETYDDGNNDLAWPFILHAEALCASWYNEYQFEHPNDHRFLLDLQVF